jgi:ferrochelatase
VEERCPGLACREIESWCDDPDYHTALARRILACRQRLDGAEGVGLLLVAHSIPERFVRKGDPYVEQVEVTVAGILDVLNRELEESLPWLLAYQSQVGPVKWVGPTVPQALEVLVSDGLRSVIVAPVSFVSDHLRPCMKSICITEGLLSNSDANDSKGSIPSTRATISSPSWQTV